MRNNFNAPYAVAGVSAFPQMGTDGASSSSTPRTKLRTVLGNRNVLPYTYNLVTNRHYSYRVNKRVASNANWTYPRVTISNYQSASTSEILTGLPTLRWEVAILKNGTFYPVTFSAASYRMALVGYDYESDNISGLTFNRGDSYIECNFISLPLQCNAHSALFTTGQVITGGTSGATGTIFGQRGYLDANTGTGTIVVGETLTGGTSGKTGVVGEILTQSGSAGSRTAKVYFASPVQFSVGEVVTGGTSGATYTVVKAGVQLALSVESGTFQANETVTDPLGGAAVVDFSTTQPLIASMGTANVWLEGALAGQNSANKYLTGNPVTTRMVAGAVTINGSGVITAIATATAGVGYPSAAQVVAYETVNGIRYSKAVGYGTGGNTSIYIDSGAPPSGLAAWTNPTIVIVGGGDFGQTTQVLQTSLTTGIPDRNVSSMLLVGDSITRGYSSTDALGDNNFNFGFHERAIANRCGVINAAVSSMNASAFADFTTKYARTYALYFGKATHCRIALGTNDITGGSGKATVTGHMTTIRNKAIEYGMVAAYATLMPCVTTTDSGVTEANQTPKTGFGAAGVAQQINTDIMNGTLPSDFAVCDPYSVVVGDTSTKFRTPASTNPTTGAISADGTHLAAYYGINLVASNSNIASSYNAVA